MKSSTFSFRALAGIAVAALGAAVAQAKPVLPPVPPPATELDLTTAGSSGTINGALFQQGEVQPTGSGVIHSFLRLQDDGTEQGYNTDYRPVQFDELTDPIHTRSLKLGAVPIVNIDGTNYRQFLLDIDEPIGGGKETLSLDKLQIYLGSAGNLHDYPTFDSQATLIYDMDALSDNYVLLSSATNKGGSGKGDMFADIPDSLFTGPNQFVYLFSRFGDHAASAGGFEEWSVNQANVIPLPAAGWSGLFTLTALAAIGASRRVRRTAAI